MHLNRETRIQRAPELVLKLHRNRFFLQTPEREKPCNYHALTVLDIFSVSRTLGEGMELAKNRVKGQWDWINLTAEIKRMLEFGALIAGDDAHKTLQSHPSGFDAAEVHIRMLKDQQRTNSYQAALDVLVKPEHVVVDVGTGTGIMAALAAKAGAKQVYAVERSSNMAKFAREFFQTNKLAERIAVIEGQASQINLPEKADILVTETIGNDPLAEGIVEICHDAKKRILRPGAALVPSHLKVMGLPTEIPFEAFRHFRFTAEDCESWSKLYGLDFSVYQDASAAAPGHARVNSHSTKTWPRLTDPIVLAEIELGKTQPKDLSNEHLLTCISTGTLNGILMYFEATLAPNIILSTHPDCAKTTNSWANLLWMPAAPVPVHKGQQVKLNYEYDVLGRRSSFHIKPDELGDPRGQNT